mmetsp:Transcript_29436/g.96054  ORF Transcript_29436/g.96054 Transcript_29436/m.96054 type:complete len:201 (-) Transcript_29436:4139-4741(-)
MANCLFVSAIVSVTMSFTLAWWRSLSCSRARASMASSSCSMASWACALLLTISVRANSRRSSGTSELSASPASTSYSTRCVRIDARCMSVIASAISLRMRAYKVFTSASASSDSCSRSTPSAPVTPSCGPGNPVAIWSANTCRNSSAAPVGAPGSSTSPAPPVSAGVPSTAAWFHSCSRRARSDSISVLATSACALEASS